MLHLLDHQSSVERGAGWAEWGVVSWKVFEGLLRVAKKVRTTHSWVSVLLLFPGSKWGKLFFVGAVCYRPLLLCRGHGSRESCIFVSLAAIAGQGGVKLIEYVESYSSDVTGHTMFAVPALGDNGHQASPQRARWRACAECAACMMYPARSAVVYGIRGWETW